MKKQIPKKKLAVLLAMTIAVTLTGCGKTVPGSGPADEITTISISGCPNKSSQPEAYQTLMDKIERFEDANPDIHIDPVEWSYDISTYTAKAEGGTLPTVYNTHFTEAKKIMELGYAKDITEKLKELGYYDKISSYVLKNSSQGNKVYFIPYNAYALGLILNMNLFREAGLVDENDMPLAPKTFAELVDTAKIIKEKTGKAGFAFPTTENSGGWYFNALAWNYGVNFEEQVNNKWKSTFDTPECVEALTYLKDLKWKHNVLPANTLINNAELMKLIATDQAAMTFGHFSQINSLSVTYGMDVNNIGLAPMPAGEENHATLMGGTYMVIDRNATEEQVDAVFKWLMFDGVTPDLTEEAKTSLRSTYQLNYDEGNILIGAKEFSVWNEKSNIQEYKNELISEFCNINPSHVKLYNEAEGIEYRVEAEYNAQDLYGLLDSCIQAVLNDANADCTALIKNASENFQANYLDYID